MFASRLAGRIAGFAAVALGLMVVLVEGGVAQESPERSEAWAALAAGGHVALIRHADAPPGSGGDPPGFRIADCATQRNLDERGRGQARALGEAFRARGVQVTRVLSSPWCRCLDTARLMAVGPAESSWALVPDVNPHAPVRLRELKEIVSGWRGPGTLVLVTHAFTVRALLGLLPEQAETVVLKPAPGTVAGGQLVGRIAPPSP